MADTTPHYAIAARLLLALTASGAAAQSPSWTRLQPANSPSARGWHELAHDTTRRRTVLFGGSSNGGTTGLLGETWEWDGVNWQQLSPPASPAARWAHGFAFDRARNRTVLFGGESRTTRHLGDTWEWDGTRWMARNPTSAPPARLAEMVYDEARRRVVLFGGEGPSANLGDTWEYDGTTWVQRGPANAPPKRAFHGMAYDSLRQRVVLFGGRDGLTVFGDTWEWDGNDWRQCRPTRSPRPRYWTSLTYDPARQRTVLFSGVGNGPVSADTWEWDGIEWGQVAPVASPTARFGHATAHDPVRGTTLLFGGFTNRTLGDTWEYTAPPTPLTVDLAEVSIATGGTQQFDLRLGNVHGGRRYHLFGSITGTTPGVPLPGPAGTVTVPLTPDAWTDLTLALANTPVLSTTRGVLSATGAARAALHVPPIASPTAIGVRLYHACLVYDATGAIHAASNPVLLTLTK